MITTRTALETGAWRYMGHGLGKTQEDETRSEIT